MRRHELELISALADGSLDDETEARALIESSEAHRMEFEAQLAALQALRRAPAVSLSDHERSALRRDVWTELRAQPTAVTGTRWYLRWTTAAAALLIVAGTGVVLGQINAPQAASDEAALTELATAESSDDAGAFDAEDGRSQGLVSGDLADPPGLAPSPAETSNLAAVANSFRSADPDVLDRATENFEKIEEHSACLASIGLEDHLIIGEYESPEGVIYIVSSPDDPVTAETVITFVDAATCAVVYTAG